MKTSRVEQHLIRKSHPMWKTIDEMCFHAKNLYNYANYTLRQDYIENGNYISYYDMNRELKTHELYKNCMSQPANCVLRLLNKNWKSFFEGLKVWNENDNKFLGRPRLPKYLNKDGRFPWMIPNNACYFENGEVKFRIKKLQEFKWITKAKGRLIQVRFIPKGTCYVMEVVTEIKIPDFQKRKPTRIASIDLGINNFVTLTNNIGEDPIIINGKGIKSINQFYNKRRAKILKQIIFLNNQHWSNKLSDIALKRFNRIKNFIHHASRYIVDYCVNNDIDTLIVGLSKQWKHYSNLGDENNQKIQSIPFDMLIKQLEYKCLEKGIYFLTTNESYTSGTSFLDGELPERDNYDISRRKKRGIFESENGMINADVNASYQIMRKVFPNAIADGIEACLTPSIINVVNI